MWLLGCNLRRDLYILFSVKRIFVTVDRIFIDLCNPRRHKNIWKGPYFIQTRGPWHNLWQIMSFSTLTFCARVWYIANMLRYKVVSGGPGVIGGPRPGRRSLLTPDWTNRKLECPDQRRHQREAGGDGDIIRVILLCYVPIQCSTHVSLREALKKSWNTNCLLTKV